MFGYHGNYLAIDLNQGAAARMPIPPEILRDFLGGVGLGTWLLHRESPPGFDPFDPVSPLIFAFSPLVGTPLTTSAKFAVVGKSPLTQRLNDALSSSHFALAGKRTGADAIVITGACREPSVLIVDEDRIAIEPAGNLWGMPTAEANQILRQRFSSDFQFAVIGPAGENRVRFATVSFDSRHAGRGGLGAILGSKNLKAIAVRGERRTELFDTAKVVAAARDLSKRSFGPATAKYRELGTVANLPAFNRLNALPTRNFQAGTFEGAESLSIEALRDVRGSVRNSCAACTIGCEHIFPGKDGHGVRLEYESLFALGPLCGIGDRDVVLAAARMCDDLGLDTISTGATIAFAMECQERGMLNAPGLHFGNGPALLNMIGKIARRDGLGDQLAEGSRRLAEQIGGEAPDFAPHVKGMELPGYEPRVLQAMALGFAVGSRGADHNRSGAYEIDFSTRADRLHGSPAAARMAVETEDKAALMDSLILCKFLRGVFADFFSESAELLAAVTGWDVSAAELQQTARRIVTAKKLFNIREGWTPAEDTLPKRFLTTALPTGPAPGGSLTAECLQEMIDAYNLERDWEADGTVPERTCRALNLSELVSPSCSAAAEH